MAKRNTKPKTNGGEVYILQIWIGNILYHKVGCTRRSARNRLIEIGTELMDQMQYFPKMRIVTNLRVTNPEAVEADILAQTKEHMPKDCPYTFSGWSEMRLMALDELQLIYDTCIAKDYPMAQPKLIEM